MKIISLVGARPQFIKEAIIHKELSNIGIEEVLIHSGQHYDFNMSDVFFESLKIKNPDYCLNVGSGSHAEMTGKIMIEFEKICQQQEARLILVYGDTNTTLAGALVGAKLKIPVGHIEAGIRMHPKDMPEEINRVVVDHVSEFKFCPSELSVENLKNEGINKGVVFSGDVMYDLFLLMKPKFKFDIFYKYNLKENSYILTTLHRDYNVDDRVKLEKILLSLHDVGKETPIVFPMHPRTMNRLKEFGLKDLVKNIIVTEPLDYLNLMGLVVKSAKIITDSGGLQKEAYFAGKSAVVLMPDTGWMELVENGCNFLANDENFFDIVMNKNHTFITENIYGKGDAGKVICKYINNL